MPLAALIHRARLLERTPAARDAQGERVEGAAVPGPWFAARLMERGGPASKSRRRAETTEARVPRGYELLADVVDVAGAPVVLTASALVETDCAILGSPTLELDGAPELCNNGRRPIVWVGYATKPGDAA